MSIMSRMPKLGTDLLSFAAVSSFLLHGGVLAEPSIVEYLVGGWGLPIL